jgi:hypothetical protein
MDYAALAKKFGDHTAFAFAASCLCDFQEASQIPPII